MNDAEGAVPAPSADQSAPMPLPQVMENITVDENDNFPKGRVSKYFPYQGYGFIIDKNGKEVYFSIAELDLVGVKGKEALRAGYPVGYDVSRTSHGLHVKKLKIY
jgi:cold shock CspA family protein